jgi:hypothetical protein
VTSPDISPIRAEPAWERALGRADTASRHYQNGQILQHGTCRWLGHACRLLTLGLTLTLLLSLGENLAARG